MDRLDSQLHNLNINGHSQTARYERKWKDVFDQKNLLKYAKNIGKKWREVGIGLSMSKAQLDTFEMDNYGITNAIVAMLNSFKNGSKKFGTSAHIEELAEAFENAELMELACDVRGINPTLNQSASPERYPEQESMLPGASSSPSPARAQTTQPVQSTVGRSGEHIQSVRPWTNDKEYERLKNDHDSVYKMTSSPRGVALIININNAAGFGPRNGSALDLQVMEKLFKQLNFDVITREDLTSDAMRAELSNLSNPKDDAMKRKLRAADCVVVFLMSHGQRDEIFASDGRVVRCEEMFEMFYRKCAELQNKPVLFFVQACRGGLVDHGTIQVDDATSGDHSEEAEQEADYSGSFVKDMIVPETADILIAYSSVPGYKSYRNTTAGSWFVTQVSEIFCEYAKEEHVEELLIRVRRRVTETLPTPARASGFQPPDKPIDIYKQCTETVSRLRKKLYFFPGI